jgi:hypothetical protein
MTDPAADTGNRITVLYRVIDLRPSAKSAGSR